MSDHANRPEQHGKPGKRLEQGAGKAKPPLAPEEAGTKKRERRIMIIMIIAAVIMVLAAAAVLLYNRWFKKPSLPPGPGETRDPAATLAPGETEPVLDIDAIQPKVGGDRKSADIYTILVFGEDVSSGNTDTMMLVTYDVTNKKATVMSLPRDTLINVRRSNKSLNAVYNAYADSEQGVEALKSEVSELVGFTPDYYVKINWDLVGEMVDAIGGVTYDIPYNMDYDDDIQNLHIHYFAGTQKLNGLQAMEIVRWRHNNKNSPFRGEGDGSDITRLNVQHSFLKAVLKQTLQIKNVPKITQLADLFGKRVESDLSVENLFWFGSQAILDGLNVDDVEFFTMPIYGVANVNAVYYGRVYPNETELLKAINEKLNPFMEEVTIRQLDLIRVSADGNTLSSSTGVLADPGAGYRPAPANPSPSPDASPQPSDPDDSQPPESHTPESEPPQESGPVETDPPQASDPVDPPPATEPPPVDLPVVDPLVPPQDPGGADTPADPE